MGKFSFENQKFYQHKALIISRKKNLKNFKTIWSLYLNLIIIHTNNLNTFIIL